MNNKKELIRTARENVQKAPQPDLAVTLRRLRKAIGLTQAEVAELLHVDRTSYAYYESGRTQPKNNTLIRIAYLYNISMDALLGIADLPPAYREDDKWDSITML